MKPSPCAMGFMLKMEYLTVALTALKMPLPHFFVIMRAENRKVME